MKDTFGFRLAEIESRWAKATPGPWRWGGNYGKGILRLVSKLGLGSIVMGFERWGNHFGIPLFRDRQRDVMARPSLVWDPDHAYLIDGISNPDAEALARSWEDVDWLVRTLKEVEPILRYLAATEVHPEGLTRHLESCPICGHLIIEQSSNERGHTNECPVPAAIRLLEEKP